MKLYYLGKRTTENGDVFKPTAVIECSEIEEKKVLQILSILSDAKFVNSAFGSEDGFIYYLPVEDREDYEELKSIYKKAKSLSSVVRMTNKELAIRTAYEGGFIEAMGYDHNNGAPESVMGDYADRYIQDLRDKRKKKTIRRTRL